MVKTSSLVECLVVYCEPEHTGAAANMGEKVRFPNRCPADVEHVSLCRLER